MLLDEVRALGIRVKQFEKLVSFKPQTNTMVQHLGGDMAITFSSVVNSANSITVTMNYGGIVTESCTINAPNNGSTAVPCINLRPEEPIRERIAKAGGNTHIEGYFTLDETRGVINFKGFALVPSRAHISFNGPVLSSN